jgi:archaeal flagellar protein FlaI
VLRLIVTKIDQLFSLVQSKKEVPIYEAAKALTIPFSSVTKISRYLEQLDLVAIEYKSIKGPEIRFIKAPEAEFYELDELELINKLKFFKSVQDIKSANKLIYSLYKYMMRRGDEQGWKIYAKVQQYYTDNLMKKLDKSLKTPIERMDSYNIELDKLVVEVDIIKQELEPVPFYILSLLKMSDVTRLVIDKVKEDVISNITFNIVYKTHEEETLIKQQYKSKILDLMKEVFPDLQEDNLMLFCDYIINTSLGMGEVEFLLRDKHLEEVVINSAHQPIWVYHKKYGWLETNIILDDESKIVHYATLAGRVVDKTITTLTPLMDAHLKSGDRVNATLKPISTEGSTMTIRKFAESPWSITDFINNGTIDYYTAALVWTAMQYELSILIVGGTGSGKTSTLNVFSIFIPPGQRVISIEDTRELRLPKTLHWVPLETRLPNPEGKGEITMLDLIVNSLRMRPDRIIVGEIRRKKEAEVLFEAMHTGHSVYATLHANTVHEAIVRLTTEPIGIAKPLLSAVDLIFVQNRNRRTGTRRTFQLAEILENGEFNLLFSYDFKKDSLVKANPLSEFYNRLNLFAGLSKEEVNNEIDDKIKVLKYFTKNNITNNEEIAMMINYYYINKKFLMNKLFGG